MFGPIRPPLDIIFAFAKYTLAEHDYVKAQRCRYEDGNARGTLLFRGKNWMLVERMNDDMSTLCVMIQPMVDPSLGGFQVSIADYQHAPRQLPQEPLMQVFKDSNVPPRTADPLAILPMPHEYVIC